MSGVPLRSDLDRMVDRYLEELAVALQRLPVSERDHLLGAIREHITELRAERPARDAWDMEALLNRVGLPEDIAAAALENVEEVDDLGPPAVGASGPVPAATATATVATAATDERRSGRTRLWVSLGAAALVLVTVVTVVSVVSTHHGDVIGSRIAPSLIVPPSQPALPSAPSRLTVPNVIGLSLAQATAALRATDLEVAVVQHPSNAVPAGEVVAQLPAAGSFVPAGSVVTLDVSSGPAS